ncbi:hypothetical protein POM88_048893 [Heracleum sosnowskyi]|uniref:Uncharacterized protein n=1 Tax=Heracleum sosnowskyi TaxID=360622 RepID=A0AAD8M119_9APIA|nr:hypothetical protein POM88_048893 [Heracleum sosnowskyi]
MADAEGLVHFGGEMIDVVGVMGEMMNLFCNISFGEEILNKSLIRRSQNTDTGSQPLRPATAALNPFTHLAQYKHANQTLPSPENLQTLISHLRLHTHLPQLNSIQVDLKN